MAYSRIVGADPITGELPPLVMERLSSLFAFGGNVLDQYHGVRYVAYGHSFGQAQTPVNCWPAGVYPERVRANLQADITYYRNETQNGTTMAQIRDHAKATWQPGQFGVVTLLGNQNEVGISHANPNREGFFKAPLRDFIDFIRGTTGSPPTILIVKDTTSTVAGYARYGTNPPTDVDVLAYNQYIDDVVAEYPSDGSLIVANALAGWNPDTMTAADGQHPNDRGQAHIAEAILAALRGRGFRPGLNFGIPGDRIVLDDFQRANSSTGLGQAKTGQSWTYPFNAVFGIAANRARIMTAVGENGYAMINAGASDVDVSLTLDELAVGCGPIFRFDASGNNGWVVDIGDGGKNVNLYKREAGTYSNQGNFSAPNMTDDSVFRVVARGEGITIYVDGVQVGFVSSAFQKTGTRVGIRALQTGTRFARFEVTA